MLQAASHLRAAFCDLLHPTSRQEAVEGVRASRKAQRAARKEQRRLERRQESEEGEDEEMEEEVGAIEGGAEPAVTFPPLKPAVSELDVVRQLQKEMLALKILDEVVAVKLQDAEGRTLVVGGRQVAVSDVLREMRAAVEPARQLSPDQPGGGSYDSPYGAQLTSALTGVLLKRDDVVAAALQARQLVLAAATSGQPLVLLLGMVRDVSLACHVSAGDTLATEMQAVRRPLAAWEQVDVDGVAEGRRRSDALFSKTAQQTAEALARLTSTVDEANVPWPLPVQYIEALALVQAAYARSPEDGKEALVKHAWELRAAVVTIWAAWMAPTVRKVQALGLLSHGNLRSAAPYLQQLVYDLATIVGAERKQLAALGRLQAAGLLSAQVNVQGGMGQVARVQQVCHQLESLDALRPFMDTVSGGVEKFDEGTVLMEFAHVGSRLESVMEEHHAQLVQAAGAVLKEMRQVADWMRETHVRQDVRALMRAVLAMMAVQQAQLRSDAAAGTPEQGRLAQEVGSLMSLLSSAMAGLSQRLGEGGGGGGGAAAGLDLKSLLEIQQRAPPIDPAKVHWPAVAGWARIASRNARAPAAG